VARQRVIPTRIEARERILAALLVASRTPNASRGAPPGTLTRLQIEGHVCPYIDPGVACRRLDMHNARVKLRDRTTGAQRQRVDLADKIEAGRKHIVTYLLERLKSHGLIEKQGTGRTAVFSLTEQGAIVAAQGAPHGGPTSPQTSRA
jgi:hypothetical protein